MVLDGCRSFLLLVTTVFDKNILKFPHRNAKKQKKEETQGKGLPESEV